MQLRRIIGRPPVNDRPHAKQPLQPRMIDEEENSDHLGQHKEKDGICDGSEESNKEPSTNRKVRNSTTGTSRRTKPTRVQKD